MKKIITINLQTALLEKIEELLIEDKSHNRSEFIRNALEWWYAEYDWESLSGTDRVITCNIEYDILKQITELVDQRVFLSRSELFRFAVLSYIQKLEKQIQKREEEQQAKPKVLVQKTQKEELISIPTQSNSAAIYKTYKIIPRELQFLLAIGGGKLEP